MSRAQSHSATIVSATSTVASLEPLSTITQRSGRMRCRRSASASADKVSASSLAGVMTEYVSRMALP
jgi:hypothetical protein